MSNYEPSLETEGYDRTDLWVAGLLGYILGTFVVLGILLVLR